MASGIYLITCTGNKKQYVGSTKDFAVRKRLHWSELRLGKHGNRHMQRSWNKYGAESFEWAVLEEVADLDRLLAREQYWIDTLHPAFNDMPNAARPSLGKKHSAETRAKISDAVKRGMQRPEVRQRLSKSTKQAWESGQFADRPPHSEETKAKIRTARAKQAEQQREQSAAKRAEKEAGREAREQVRREKLRKANTGKKPSKATRQKLREAATKQMSDPAQRQKHQQATREAMQRPEVKEKHRKGIANRPPVSAETREKIGKAHQGRKRPPETGQKIAEAQRARWARILAEKDKDGA